MPSWGAGSGSFAATWQLQRLVSCWGLSCTGRCGVEGRTAANWAATLAVDHLLAQRSCHRTHAPVRSLAWLTSSSLPPPPPLQAEEKKDEKEDEDDEYDDDDEDDKKKKDKKAPSEKLADKKDEDEEEDEKEEL